MRRLVRVVPLILLAASVAVLLGARHGQTVPLYAARTGLLCGQCHFDPNGGGPRNDFGFAFARSRHSLTPEDSASEWHDLSVSNRVGDAIPIYLGLNHRFMLITNTTQKSDSLDRLGFFNMENAFHLTFQPHRRLTLVYTRDGFDGLSSSKEAFGLISGFPMNGYFKGGRFRTPFGLRMDDHTVATRNGFLDFASVNGGSFLPYDPRSPDMGYEVGLERGPAFGRLAFTNGGTHPLGSVNTNAQAVTAKLGMNEPYYQGAISFYDDFHRENDFASGGPVPIPTRATRWGYYGLTHRGPFELLGEIAAGTDTRDVYDPDSLRYGSVSRNALAGFAELDWTPDRTWNVRLRFDRMELNRSSDKAVRESNTHQRYALEGEWVPVPFAELRLACRRIDHKDAAQKDETQAYLQLHFSY